MFIFVEDVPDCKGTNSFFPSFYAISTEYIIFIRN